jgi:DNA helicase-2/ATP-dependent DNA helicase PcrA
VANAVLLGGGRGVDRAGALQATRPDGPVPSVHAYDDDRAEARGVARAVRDHHAPGATWSGQAVLVRTNAQIPALEEALKAAQIPFRVRGAAPLLEQPEIKAAMGDLRRSRGGFDDAVADLAASIDEAAGTGDRAEERRANVDALLQLARDYAAVEGTPTVPGFLSWLASTTRADQPDRYGDAVEITTFHAAKGLEWPIVHLAGLEQGLVPIGHARTGEALSEELRLFYVAVTRGEREVVCSWAGQRRYGTRDLRRERSPYLDTVMAASAELRAGTDPAEVGKGVSVPAKPEKPAKPKHTRSRTRPDLPRAAGAPAPADLDDEGRLLLDALRVWRTDKARAAGMPAYVICNDRTLVEIASVRPTSPDELLTVHGMGEVKVGRFGAELLTLVGETGGEG